MILWIPEQPGWERSGKGAVLGLGVARQVPMWMDSPPSWGPPSPPLLQCHGTPSPLELRCIPGEQGGKYKFLEIKFLFLKVKDFIRKVKFSYSKKKLYFFADLNLWPKRHSTGNKFSYLEVV